MNLKISPLKVGCVSGPTPIFLFNPDLPFHYSASPQVHPVATNSLQMALTRLSLIRIDWPQEETEQAAGTTANGGTVHLWEESWDDDDAAEDFSKQLKCVPPSFLLLLFLLSPL